MMFALVYSPLPDRAALLLHDLLGVGLRAHLAGALATLAQDVHQHRPDVVVCLLTQADGDFFAATRAIAGLAPCPVLVFTDSPDLAQVALAPAAGVHAYVADGYAPQRLRVLIAVAQARHQHESTWRAALADAANLLDERKVVDRAKTILMRARQLSDDDAFRLLRTASMHSNQRLAEVSQHIIHSAHFADGVNRAGQLRMLSQRLVKLQALQLLLHSESQPGLGAALQDSLQRIDANLALLAKSFSQPEITALVKRAGLTWARLKRMLKRLLKAQDMGAIDALAESLLDDAERLTSLLESTGSAQPLQVLNLAGRQRMLSQRFAKYALLHALTGDVSGHASGSGVEQGDSPLMREARDGFEKAQHYLNNIPLSTPAIGHLLASAKLDWQRMLAGVLQAHNATGQQQIFAASEDLLTVFEQLSATYETSMQMLMG